MSFSRKEFTNHERLKSQMGRYGMDAVIGLSPPNLTYTSGFYNFDMNLLAYERLHATITDANGDVTFIHPKREEPVETFAGDVRVYDSSVESAYEILKAVVSERGLSGAAIGIELETVPAAIVRKISDALPNVTWVGADDYFNEVRLIKTPAEVEHLRRAAIATERGIMSAYSLARPGDSEKDIVDLMGYAVTRNGADFIAFNVFASGPRTIEGHHLAEPAPLETGAILRVDYGGNFSGYFSDLVRMAVVGPPSDRQRDIYQRSLELHREMIELCRPGVSLKELWETTCKSHERLNLPMTRRMFGHSIGLSVHEPPIIDAFGSREIEPGMVLCIEHGWTDHQNRERFHIEDEIVVTDGGPDVLSDSTSIDEMFVIA